MSKVQTPHIDTDDPSIAFGLTLHEVSRGWRTRVDERLRPLGLSSAASLVIATLAITKKLLTQKDLAALCFVEGPSMARLLDRLEAKGFVRREAALGDRRKKHVVLTELSWPIITDMSELCGLVRDELLGDISEAELSQALKVLRSIRVRLGDQADASGCPVTS